MTGWWCSPWPITGANRATGQAERRRPKRPHNPGLAFLPYLRNDAIPAEHRVPDDDHILRIHGVHPAVMRRHYNLYIELMRGPSPLTRVQREMIAVVVSATNGCHY